MSEVSYRPERPDDIAAIHAVVAAAFGHEDEAQLVDALRDAGKLSVSLIACHDEQVIGHIAFSQVEIATNPRHARVAGLAPLSVAPAGQGEGVGSALVREGLAACMAAGFAAAVVLGEPGYYGRFGFTRGGGFGLENEYGADAGFMAVELAEGALVDCSGLVRYAPEFAALG